MYRFNHMNDLKLNMNAIAEKRGLSLPIIRMRSVQSGKQGEADNASQEERHNHFHLNKTHMLLAWWRLQMGFEEIFQK